ncbi:MAG: Na+/H+ antiporter subunit E [Pseudomonadota bacterium]
MNDSGSTDQPLLRIVTITVILAIAWLLWSGLYKPLLIGLGAFSCALTIFLLLRMQYFHSDTFAFRYSPRLIVFWGWLGKEIVISSIQVARQVLSPRIDVTPKTVEIDVSDLDTLDQALLGNSITLTPGTLALDLHDGRLLVHALTHEGAAELERGEMHARVRALRSD